MNRRIESLFLILITATVFACGNDADSGPDGSNPPPSNNQSPPASVVNECKTSCNQQKFFNCYDAAQHAACFRNCEQADQSGIELFVNCVSVEVCDSACAFNITPAEPAPEPTADDCTAACNALVMEACIEPVDCAGACSLAPADEKAFFAYCAANRNGCEFPEACQFEEEVITPQDLCVESCHSLGFFDCITGPDVAECTSTCGTLDDGAAQGFYSCVQSQGICSDDSCYQLISEGASANVSGCRSSCDHLEFFDCLDAAEHSECRTVCAMASADAVNTFISCTRGLCDDNGCYMQLLDSL